MPTPVQLEILRGPAGSGKTAAALDAYRQVLAGESPRLGEQPRALWLAPSLAAVAGLRDALVDGPGDVFLDPGVSTFIDFAAEAVWSSGRSFRRLSPLERRHALRRIIAEAAAEGTLDYFRQVAESPGMLNLVDEAIAGLKRRDISPAAYEATTRTACAPATGAFAAVRAATSAA